MPAVDGWCTRRPVVGVRESFWSSRFFSSARTPNPPTEASPIAHIHTFNPLRQSYSSCPDIHHPPSSNLVAFLLSPPLLPFLLSMGDFNSTASTLFEASNQLIAMSAPYLEYLAPLAPYNPQPVFKQYWEAMCGRYSEYQIATSGSLLVQVLFYFGCSLPGFFYQFFTFMKAYKVQKNKAHSLAEQWQCLRRVMFSKTFIYVSRTKTTTHARTEARRQFRNWFDGSKRLTFLCAYLCSLSLSLFVASSDHCSLLYRSHAWSFCSLLV